MLDFNLSMHRFMAEVVRIVPELGHIQLSSVAVSATFNHSRRRSGLLAYVVPLRYRHGRPVEVRHRAGREYHFLMPTVENGSGGSLLYIIYFMLPRFLHLNHRQKLETVVHELYHIGPTCNGDLRRFRGRSELHGDHASYNNKVRCMTDFFLQQESNPEIHEFLRWGYSRTERLYGGIHAVHLPEPKPKVLKVVSLQVGPG